MQYTPSRYEFLIMWANYEKDSIMFYFLMSLNSYMTIRMSMDCFLVFTSKPPHWRRYMLSVSRCWHQGLQGPLCGKVRPDPWWTQLVPDGSNGPAAKTENKQQIMSFLAVRWSISVVIPFKSTFFFVCAQI